jgi:hypothetical protein
MASRIRKGGVVMPLCLPAEIKAYLEREADRNFSSQNAEIVRALRTQMERAQSEKVAS